MALTGEKSRSTADVTLIVLAGGGSRRMGTDKTRISVSGRTLLDHVLNQVRDRFGEILVSVSPDGPSEVSGFPSVRDQRSGFGPMEGIRRGLERAAHETCFILACDIPDIDFGLVERLLRNSGHADIAVPVSLEGTVEPLFGVYKQRVWTEAERLLSEGRRSVLALHDALRTTHVPITAEEKLLNLNTLADVKNYLSAR
jgi:molybdopterin-guanine dinucleotide biosynthesis protein A